MKKLISVFYFFLISLTFFDLKSMIANFDSTQKVKESFPQKMVITVPVADLRTKAEKAPPNPQYPISGKDNPFQDTKYSKYPISCEDDPLQVSQLLLGEYILACYKKNNPITKKSWLKIYALEQKKFSNGRKDWGWQQGWIEEEQTIPVKEFPSHNLVIKKQWAMVHNANKKKDKDILYVSIGTKLLGQYLNNEDFYKVFLPNEQIGKIHSGDVYRITPEITESETDLRKNIIQTAKTFENAPYCWGGRCGYLKNIMTLEEKYISVDCSGFVNLVYRANGLEIPRDAHDQFLLCRKYRQILNSGKELKNGDLIFFASIQNPTKIVHVALYENDKKFFGRRLLESTGEWQFKNRIITDIIKLGNPIEKIKSGEKPSKKRNYFVYFGSYLASEQLRNQLRAEALRNRFPEIIS